MPVSGQKVGRLTVEYVVGKSKNGSYVWRCSCECGGEIDVISSSLNSKLTKSCGCLYDETRRFTGRSHGMTGSREYNAWNAMKQRCYYEKHQYYYLYGERGIQVCSRWLGSFENFYEDMGDCPEGYSLDRIDSDGDYCPDNCKWSSAKEQAFNQRQRSSNKSGRTGVYKTDSAWTASIRVGGKSTHLGSFRTFEEACRVRADAEMRIYGFVKE